MSLFDLQDVCIAIGSIATLDLPMVVDLIGIYGLKGPYCKLTTTNWFLQALSVIPRGSWGDVARRSYHDPLGRNPKPRDLAASPPLHTRRRRRTPPPTCAAAARLRRKIVSGQFDEENPFVLISSVLIVQADEGVSFLVVDRIGDFYRNLPRRADVIVTTVGARHKCQQGIQLAVGPQQLRLRKHIFGLTNRIMVKRLATSSHDPLGITDSACKNQSVMVSVQYGLFNTYIPIRSTTIGKSIVARDPITLHTS
ncbi:hypothetical protein F511_12821 [Dorcoceras hygrometricum]|uniref:Uncharacterized protein n=1 Tax=Dorcoceras hygrometricum TaxID=472368 RepID=A0A2Z7CT06_9LAMI|nr:hypothetical protein F511_12821 [Dorcoceras hygrometricum]